MCEALEGEGEKTMRKILRTSALIALATGLLVSPSLATTLMHLNVGAMSERADRIFRGTVLEVSEGETEVGGGVLPTTTYTIEVDESFKGEFSTVKGVRLVEIRMVGKIAPKTVGQATHMSVFRDMPRMTLGESYLLFSTSPSAVGLSTTVGLGQGCFHLSSLENKLMAVNGFDNVGLFSGMDVGDVPVRGPVSYDRLTDVIRAGLAISTGGN